ncbi:MAG: hypothetical protein ACLSVX_02610 [Massilimicrobiota timonensis]
MDDNEKYEKKTKYRKYIKKNKLLEQNRKKHIETTKKQIINLRKHKVIYLISKGRRLLKVKTIYPNIS